ncbi:pre-mRNA-splicing factor Slu7 [Phlebotomus papatasi]|uniref:Pre-mRNA-splicing factor SLU7 n=1 Tax=Phlebotomus papatasi TaxID=29031 RepID=A0A1B0DLM9_PHLPP|nr:pre-mRNA-splicing factor Slu7 [Phlebotomus papatasi]
MANATPRVPISQLLTNKSGDEEPKKKSREDWRKAKELEEARKAGTAPAAVDEEGKDINPHIPQYISTAPWYYGSAGPTLRHQRPQEEKKTQYSSIDEWYKKGVDTSKVITKYRKGACENCGALTHKKKDCMERPRKVGAKFSGAKIAHDEFIQPNIVSDYDGKRDRWSGYDPAQHREIVEEYQKVEEAKRALKAAKLKDNPDAELSADEEDEDKYVDEVDMPGTKVDSKQRITVRNLRIREDTAKYLRNLDPNSAYYDPKTRSMRDNPEPNKKPEDSEFAGENFVRFTGDTQKHSKAQLFAWEAYGKGVDVHILAEPTKLELLQNEYDKKKDQFKSQVKDTILDKYGGEEHLQVPPKALLLAQTEEYVEYSRSGKVIKGQEKQIVRSRYEEDVLINNHTAVWGSYWNMGQWGYKCCHSFIKNSYCLGESGKASQVLTIPTKIPAKSHPEDTEDKSTEQEESAKSSSNSSDSDSEEDEEEARKRQKAKKKSKKKRQKEKKKQRKQKEGEKDKLKEALLAEEKHNRQVSELMKLDERKRPYNSMYEVKKPSEEEMEAFMMKRRREEDPMLQFLDP